MQYDEDKSLFDNYRQLYDTRHDDAGYKIILSYTEELKELRTQLIISAVYHAKTTLTLFDVVFDYWRKGFPVESAFDMAKNYARFHHVHRIEVDAVHYSLYDCTNDDMLKQIARGYRDLVKKVLLPEVRIDTRSAGADFLNSTLWLQARELYDDQVWFTNVY